MNEILQKYIQEMQYEKAAQEKAERDERLINAGLCKIVYIDNNASDESVYINDSEAEYDPKSGRYYKKVPVELTDEEYEEFSKVYDDQPCEEANNNVATVLKVIAWIIYIGGFIAGIVLGNVGNTSYHSDFSFPLAFGCWGAVFVSGTLVLGFAEIIKLLTEIRNK